jgi:hypothetical protein
VGTHEGFVSGGGVCKPQNGTLKVCTQERYYCFITNGPLPPNEDAFIEWFYLYEHGNPAPGAFTGKMSWSANNTYLQTFFVGSTGPGYAGPNGNGIPMWVQSNHNT